jgi:hypothetical protein
MLMKNQSLTRISTPSIIWLALAAMMLTILGKDQILLTTLLFWTLHKLIRRSEESHTPECLNRLLLVTVWSLLAK